MLHGLRQHSTRQHTKTAQHDSTTRQPNATAHQDTAYHDSTAQNDSTTRHQDTTAQHGIPRQHSTTARHQEKKSAEPQSPRPRTAPWPSSRRCTVTRPGPTGHHHSAAGSPAAPSPSSCANPRAGEPAKNDSNDQPAMMGNGRGSGPARQPGPAPVHTAVHAPPCDGARPRRQRRRDGRAAGARQERHRPPQEGRKATAATARGSGGPTEQQRSAGKRALRASQARPPCTRPYLLRRAHGRTCFAVRWGTGGGRREERGERRRPHLLRHHVGLPRQFGLPLVRRLRNQRDDM